MKCILFGFLILLHVISFSLGDELGLAESLGNVEGSKRRALNIRNGPNNIGVLPASKLQAQPTPQPIQQSRPHALTVRPNTQVKKSVPTVASQLPKTMPHNNNNRPGKMTEATSLPLGVPAFRPIPPAEERPIAYDQSQMGHNNFNKKIMPSAMFQYPISNHQISNNATVQNHLMKSQSIASNLVTASQNRIDTYHVPAFQAMPSSVSRISTGAIVPIDRKPEATEKNSVYISPIKSQGFKPTAPTYVDAISVPNNRAPIVDLMGHTVEELAVAANVSVEAIQIAIRQREQQLIAEQQAAIYEKITKTTTTTTSKPIRLTAPPSPTVRSVPKYQIAGGHKVMNAPKEYYPVGYDKNFDDNFTTKVDLPHTSFHCGDQKHFPGLYADEDLGCMVFHVCALTDDGLIMKSFLCPESTLFDQTILKCNWWFYVDCKNSRSIYDSNIPVSKSYQLMKALTFFSSNYKNSPNVKDGVDVEALKNSVAANKAT